MKNFRTKDIKLAALILAVIPGSTFYVESLSIDSRQTIVISFSESFQNEVNDLTSRFINCEAVVNLYKYNYRLNLIRDELKGGRK